MREVFIAIVLAAVAALIVPAFAQTDFDQLHGQWHQAVSSGNAAGGDDAKVPCFTGEQVTQVEGSEC